MQKQLSIQENKKKTKKIKNVENIEHIKNINYEMQHRKKCKHAIACKANKNRHQEHR